MIGCSSQRGLEGLAVCHLNGGGTGAWIRVEG